MLERLFFASTTISIDLYLNNSSRNILWLSEI